MKLLALPKGRQSGIEGAVVNVSVQAEQVCNVLPNPKRSRISPIKIEKKAAILRSPHFSVYPAKYC